MSDPASPELAYLFALPRFAGTADDAYRPGLERMETLLEAMSQPHKRFESIHVAGTNGKGSTASLTAAIATAMGRRTGLHTSPHLVHVTERMRIDGAPAPTDWLEDAVRRHRPLFDRVGPSFFEATVALSLLYFAERSVDVAVVEVGLGGRLDATNVLHPRLSVVTHVGRDHEALLGDTLAAIAREKAGIVKWGTPVLTAVDAPEALAVLRAVAANREAPLHEVRREVAATLHAATLDGLRLDAKTPVRCYDGLRVGLAGRHQLANALLALRAAELALAAPPEAICAGLAEVRHLAGLRGRCEVLGRAPLVVADVAHNPEGLAVALDLVRPHVAGRLVVALGAMRDKDVPAMARLLAEAGATVWPLALASERAASVETLTQALEEAGASVEPPTTPEQAIERFHSEASPPDGLLLAGSHRVVGALGAHG